MYSTNLFRSSQDFGYKGFLACSLAQLISEVIFSIECEIGGAPLQNFRFLHLLYWGAIWRAFFWNTDAGNGFLGMKYNDLQNLSEIGLL